MVQDGRTLTIVYQFGKVASTSLVNTLRKEPSLEVQQSHFLGEDALKRIIPIAVAKSTNAYFHEHLRGQLLANVELTYKLNRVLSGEGAMKAKIISLSRNPIDWFRSGIQQDIIGYREDLLNLAQPEANDGDEGALLQRGLVDALQRIADIIEKKGGVTATVDEFHEIGGKAMLERDGEDAPQIVRRLFFLALRPLTWFEEHFRPCFGLALSDFDRREGFWLASRDRADFALLRYEDIETSLGPAVAALGLPRVGPLLRDNVSKTKPYAADVTKAFASVPAARLGALLRGSDYARFFGYDEPSKVAVTAAE